MEKLGATHETREVMGFDEVVWRNSSPSAMLYLVQGETEGLTIEAQPELLARLRTEVRGRKLILRPGGPWRDRLRDMTTNCPEKLRIKYFLNFKNLRRLDIYGAGVAKSTSVYSEDLNVKLHGAGCISIDALQTRKLCVRNDGAGVIHLKGDVAVQNVRMSGVGSYEAGELSTVKSSITIYGSGRARVHAIQMLKAVVRGTGIVVYRGNPEIQMSVFGPGRITRMSAASSD